jgi:malate/lactate dehydrogenase
MFAERMKILAELGMKEDEMCPVIGTQKIGGMNVDQLLKMAEGSSKLKKEVQREGLVFKSCELIDRKTISFKAISNLYLLKKG